MPNGCLTDWQEARGNVDGAGRQAVSFHGLWTTVRFHSQVFTSCSTAGSTVMFLQSCSTVMSSGGSRGGGRGFNPPPSEVVFCLLVSIWKFPWTWTLTPPSKNSVPERPPPRRIPRSAPDVQSCFHSQVPQSCFHSHVSTVMFHSHVSIVMFHAVRSHCQVHSHVPLIFQSCLTATFHSHAPQSRFTVTLHSHAPQSRSTVNFHSQGLHGIGL